MTKAQKLDVKIKTLKILQNVLQMKISWTMDDVASAFRFTETDQYCKET